MGRERVETDPRRTYSRGAGSGLRTEGHGPASSSVSQELWIPHDPRPGPLLPRLRWGGPSLSCCPGVPASAAGKREPPTPLSRRAQGPLDGARGS